MTSDAPLSIDAVRLTQLAAQGLLNPPSQPANKATVLDIIRRMGVLQIDTIHVVARSPYLVLFSRLGNYTPAWLDELLAEGALFEYWAHAACFVPVEDYQLYYHRMIDLSSHYYKAEWVAKHAAGIEQVMGRIRANGPVRSADFERTDGQKGGWWNWKEEKQVLEYLHTSGELMIARREKFQRIYDLRERVLPAWETSQALPVEAARDVLSLKAVKALGAAPARWVPDYFRLPKTGMAERLKRLTGEGLLNQVQVEGWAEPFYVHPDNLPLLDQALAGDLIPTVTALLSPFDPLTWDRARALALFNFEYNIECYLPEAKRRYGYFSLPILHRGCLIGRLDAKAHRKDGIFEVKALHLENGVAMTDQLAAEVGAAIRRCAEWHGTPDVVIRKSDPAEILNIIVDFCGSVTTNHKNPQ